MFPSINYTPYCLKIGTMQKSKSHLTFYNGRVNLFCIHFVILLIFSRLSVQWFFSCSAILPLVVWRITWSMEPMWNLNHISLLYLYNESLSCPFCHPPHVFLFWCVMVALLMVFQSKVTKLQRLKIQSQYPKLLPTRCLNNKHQPIAV